MFCVFVLIENQKKKDNNKWSRPTEDECRDTSTHTVAELALTSALNKPLPPMPVPGGREKI